MYIVGKNHNVKDAFVHCGLWLWIEIDISSWYRVAIIERVKLIIEGRKVCTTLLPIQDGMSEPTGKINKNYSSQIKLVLETMTIKLS